jgi:hypothetical protein
MFNGLRVVQSSETMFKFAAHIKTASGNHFIQYTENEKEETLYFLAGRHCSRSLT